MTERARKFFLVQFFGGANVDRKMICVLTRVRVSRQALFRARVVKANDGGSRMLVSAHTPLAMSFDIDYDFGELSGILIYVWQERTRLN